MGIILSAMAAAGDAGVQSQNQNIMQLHQMEAEKNKSILETQKAQAISDIQTSAANATANRAGAMIRSSADEQVPVQAPAVTQLSGDDPNSPYVSPDGSPTTGLHGDYQALKDRLSMISDPSDRTAALTQLDRQRETDQATAQSSLDGQARPRTQQEVIANSMKNLMESGDLQGYAALKAAMGDKFTIVPDGASYLNNQTGQLTSTGDGKQARQDSLEDRKDIRQDKALAASLAASGGQGHSTTTTDAKYLLDNGIAKTPEEAWKMARKVSANEFTGDPAQNAVAADLLIKGDMSATTLLAKLPPAQKLAIVALAKEKDPKYSSRMQIASQKSADRFAAGPDGDQTSNYNASADHLDMLKESFASLKNGDIQLFNKIGNEYAKATGKAAPANAEAITQLVAGEIVKAVTNGNGALGDREGLERNLAAKLSPGQIESTIEAYNGMITAQIHAKNLKYNANNPAYVIDPDSSDFARYLSPRVRTLTGIAPPAGLSDNWGTISPAKKQSMQGPGSPLSGKALNYDPKTGTFH